MMKLQKHNWIGKPLLETLGILLIPFICCMVIFCLPQTILENNALPEFAWLFLIVFIDVGHVYSTLYRTYIDKPLVIKNKNLFFGLPILLLIFSVLLHSTNPLWFWRVLAYIAVYHFIRQQYGFLRLYSRKNIYSRLKQNIDTFTIYAVTGLPVVYWHFSGDRNFQWFLKGDFILLNLSSLLILTQALFWTILILYTLSEFYSIFRTRELNFQKNMIIYGTALAWYAGIIYFNSDIIFTILNIICHGIPYMTLVWIHGKKKHSSMGYSSSPFKLIYGQFSLFFFLAPLLIFAWFEEGLWDSLVWKEHSSIFSLFNFLQTDVSKTFMNFIVPLLALPQLFHYVIDGFIWKLKKDKFEWSKFL